MSLSNNVIRKTDKAKYIEAKSLRNQEKYSEALSIIELLLPKYANNISLILIAADTNWELGNVVKAVSYFKMAIELSPKSEDASLGLFHCLWEIGKQEEALEEVKRFMSLSFSEEYMEIIREINEKAG